ncbi:putative gastrointestinal growth factor xP4 [Micropterus salmoides]|uniref:putative gastrointestinal growth factor xP4 n=1 Tax=Micropterus salmoides TaxID=27706 RepID=UPI0018EC08FA|nr:putative gastrointestinal growth factor xP4 [Micropterus salmoides]
MVSTKLWHPHREQVTCGQSGISSSDCEMMGCCVDSSTSTCYYPMDECTVDQHFVVRHSCQLINPCGPHQACCFWEYKL